MALVDRFEAYAADFELTFIDDDWTRLDRHFTDDAVYSTPANGLRVSGRARVLATLRAAIFGFDRRCDTRSLATTEGPREDGDEVFRKWAARFTLVDAPDLEIDGSERAKFRGERIELLEVTLASETLARLMNYGATYLASRVR
jgi:ketosteroid isomerase-like protein